MRWFFPGLLRNESLLKASLLEKRKEKANPPAAENKNAATPF
jgi:hypothetical protein